MKFNKYCKFANFSENFIFANNVKGILATLKICDYGMIHMISKRQISRGFYFHDTGFALAKFRKNITVAKFSEFAVYENMSVLSFKWLPDNLLVCMVQSYLSILHYGAIVADRKHSSTH